MASWSVTFWDVGQGDASDIVTESGDRIFIDMGPLKSTGNPIPAWLERKRNPPIHSVVITHNHLDHFGGLVSAAANRNQQIGRVYLLNDSTAQKSPLDKTFDVLLVNLKERSKGNRTSTKWLSSSPCTLYKDRHFRLQLLRPTLIPSVTKSSANKTSMALSLESVRTPHKCYVLWCGDSLLADIAICASASCPKWMMGPHHGAPQDKQNEAGLMKLVRGIGPQTLFISLGRDNPYSHPRRQYLSAARRTGATCCCSELSEFCVKRRPVTNIFPGSAQLGLDQPIKTVQCRGSVRLVINPTSGRVEVKGQNEFLRALHLKVPNGRCLRPLGALQKKAKTQQKSANRSKRRGR